MWNGSVYNIKNTLIIRFLNEIYRLLTKSFRFLPSRIRKNSCSYRPAESQRAHACHSDRKTQLSGEQNNRLGDSMNEKLLLLIPRLTVEYKGQKRAYQQCRIKMFTIPLSHVQRRWNLMPTRWRLGMRASDPYPRPRYREEWRTRDKREIKYSTPDSDLEITALRYTVSAYGYSKAKMFTS